MDKGFAKYTVRGNVFYGKVDYLIIYLVLTCNDETSVDAAESLMHIKGQQSPVKLSLKARGVGGITCTIKLR